MTWIDPERLGRLADWGHDHIPLRWRKVSVFPVIVAVCAAEGWRAAKREWADLWQWSS